jgi:hypothetical protein
MTLATISLRREKMTEFYMIRLHTEVYLSRCARNRTAELLRGPGNDA